MKKTRILLIIFLTLIFLVLIEIKTFALSTEYEGFTVIGRIEIPKTNIDYPILEKVTKKSLEKGIPLLYGAGINKEGNSVLVGHNYRNNMFFSKNKDLKIGDEIYITGTDDVKEKYIVYKKFEASPEDTSFYQMDKNGSKVITLSSATDDSKQRLIIQAKSEGVTDWINNNDSTNNSSNDSDNPIIDESNDNIDTSSENSTNEEDMTESLDSVSEKYEMQEKSNKVLASLMVIGIKALF